MVDARGPDPSSSGARQTVPFYFLLFRGAVHDRAVIAMILTVDDLVKVEHSPQRKRAIALARPYVTGAALPPA